MAHTLFVRIDPTASEATWQLAEHGRLLGPQGQGTLDEAQRAARGTQVVVLVPAEEIFLNYVVLPGKNRQKLRKAIPYAVEDQLVDDIEDLHFALSSHTQHGKYLVAAVEERMMQFWDKVILAAGIRCETIVPDVSALGIGSGHWTVLLEPNRALVRTADEMFASDIDMLPVMLGNLYAQLEEDQRPEVRVYDCSHAAHMAALRDATPDIVYQVHDCAQGAFGLFASQYDARHSVNLLQGEYNRQQGLRKHLRPWYPAAALLAIWVVWLVGLNTLEYIQLNNRSKELVSEMRKVHQSAFAGAKLPAPGYERSDMEARLKQLRRQQGHAEGGLSEMLVKTTPVLKGLSEVSIEGLRYLNGNLEVELSMKQTEQLEALKSRITEQTGWEVKSQASTEKGVTRVRLRISSGKQ